MDNRSSSKIHKARFLWPCFSSFQTFISYNLIKPSKLSVCVLFTYTYILIYNLYSSKFDLFIFQFVWLRSVNGNLILWLSTNELKKQILNGLMGLSDILACFICRKLICYIWRCIISWDALILNSRYLQALFLQQLTVKWLIIKNLYLCLNT